MAQTQDVQGLALRVRGVNNEREKRLTSGLKGDVEKTAIAVRE